MSIVNIKNHAALSKAFEKQMKNALEQTQETVYEIIRESILEYYGECSPTRYQR